MTGKEIRDTFLNFFKDKQHQIVPSAPMVVKDDPTLMFTNAGMNQFKDWFLGNSKPKWERVANTQKCLRVSGKHNDLEEVGHDTYHHTMFEMLGNWSFGNYFKKEAIAWAWELLTEVYKIDKDRLYVTVFEGDKNDNLSEDKEAIEEWKKHIPEDRIIFGNKKDNFWEMGETGPCGPCSEVHIDIRSDKERAEIDGKTLVNTDHYLVVEIWNLVFIQYNRLADQSLVSLPQKHVDTGMGFERLCMVLQGKQSNYDTDIFMPLINEISKISGVEYGKNTDTDIAIRVIADHIRAVSFAIADGQLPSNVKAGYVIRRILRRAVRYAYSYLNVHEPFMYKLVPCLEANMGYIFPELTKQKDIIVKVIIEEEQSFLKTLATGINMFKQHVKKIGSEEVISGSFAFEMYDTYGFPIDLTQLMSKEINKSVDMEEFQKLLNEQKERSRQSANVIKGDWFELIKDGSSEFVGYDNTEYKSKIVRYRKAETSEEILYHIVLDKTPFYAESGGQVGDVGFIKNSEETIPIIDTKKENELIIHITEHLPKNLSSEFTSIVDVQKRKHTANNHTATHLLHHALRQILGNHVEQKGSYVCADYLRFDFSHFQKLSDEEIKNVEVMVNKLIQDNITLDVFRNIEMQEAQQMGAVALFGEKYGDKVRVVKFGDSVELCGGTHVKATGNIGLFKIISESAIAAGIRRIEAVTSDKAWEYIYKQDELIEKIKLTLKNKINPIGAIEQLQATNDEQKKEIEEYRKKEIAMMKSQLISEIKSINDIKLISKHLDLDNITIKNIAQSLTAETSDLMVVITSNVNRKPNIVVALSSNLVKEKQLHAGNIVKKLAAIISGGGGGQPNYATAGGKNPDKINQVISEINNNIENYLI